MTIVFCRAMFGGFQSSCWIKIQRTARDCPGTQIRKSGLSVAALGSGSLTSLSPAAPSTSAWADRHIHCANMPRALPTHSSSKAPLCPCPPAASTGLGTMLDGGDEPVCTAHDQLLCHAQQQCHRPLEILHHPGQVRPVGWNWGWRVF